MKKFEIGELKADMEIKIIKGTKVYPEGDYTIQPITSKERKYLKYSTARKLLENGKAVFVENNTYDIQ